jgi:DNA-binding IclR family transcriptional regulator
MNDGAPSPQQTAHQTPHQTRKGQSSTTNAILDELEREPGSTTKELAAATSLPYRTVHGYLMPLCGLGLVACTKIGDVNSWRLIRRPAPTLSDRLIAAYSPEKHWATARPRFGAGDVAMRFTLSLSMACRLLRSMEAAGQIHRVPSAGRRRYSITEVKNAE